MTRKKRKIENYAHADKTRVNNPQAGLVTPATDPDLDSRQHYAHDPHIDPELNFDAQTARDGLGEIIAKGLKAKSLKDALASLAELQKAQAPHLNWAGKAEHTGFEVPTVSLHVHERIDPRAILEAVRQRNGDETQKQGALFEAAEQNLPLRKAVEFYQHAHNWSNRFIAGDSLLVMNSLLQKEDMAGKVQCVYFDPPYGIKYGSNFQPFVGKREVKDGKAEDLTTEPEMIKAFRDTWELGIHSYLTYLRNRLLLARDLLSESGSVFVQIGDENVHRVGSMMDGIFGSESRIATITFNTSSGSSTNRLPEVSDYLLWYARDPNKVKYRQLYEKLTRVEMVQHFSSYAMVQLADGTTRKPTREERVDPEKYLPDGSRLYKRTDLRSQGRSNTGRSEPYEFDGRKFPCGETLHWSVSPQGMDRLGKLGRLEALEGSDTLAWKKYEEEFPGRRLNSNWSTQMYSSDKRYVVQTSNKVIQRCILMSTDPGDLVFDPTCGSGTTAQVAEEWGRRWITCDSSRVALAIAKQRLMTSTFKYYKLAHPEEGVGSGFECESTPYVSAARLAYDMPQESTILHDRPHTDPKKTRVTGPFTVEATPAPAVRPIDEVEKAAADDQLPADSSVCRSGETLRQQKWRDELLKTGIRGKGGQHINFSRMEPLPHRWLHAAAETHPDEETEPCAHSQQQVVVSFGPEHAPMTPIQVESALQEALTLPPPPPPPSFKPHHLRRI